MARYARGTNNAAYVDPSSDNILDPGVFGGKLRHFYDEAIITDSATLKSVDYIEVGGKLPTGAQVVRIHMVGVATTLGSSSNVDIGDQGDDDRYCASVSCAATGFVAGPNASGGVGYKVTGTTDNYIRIVPATNGSSVSSGTIKIDIFYVVE